jgi:hypothetical protein
MDDLITILERNLVCHKVHILVFLVAFFIAITVAHPSLLITDEWITVNQLSQLHDGHQVLFNEGKYGFHENGTASRYFTHKDNYLAYPLFLPLISLPAYWLTDIFGGNFIFFMLYLWIFLLIAIALVLNGFFPECTSLGKWRWTTGLIIGSFVIFFINLFFYRPFPITGKDSYPEIIAIVFTNIILFAILAVMVYEILRTIFNDSSYTIFGAVLCITSSSYLFWTSFCKDHVLVAFLFTAIVLLAVKFSLTTNDGYLPGAFILTGLLAWARPELALFVFISLCILIAYGYLVTRDRFTPLTKAILVVTAPLFTLIGAIPFCINNYLFTGNFFVPAWILWKTGSSSVNVTVAESTPVQQASSDTLGSLLQLFMSTINIQPATFLSDVYGVLLNPQTGSMGVLPLVPLFMGAILILPILWVFGNRDFSCEEKHILMTMGLLALGVFLAYVRGITGMNTSPGINPDIRYLSPIYLPLSIMGLVVIGKVPSLRNNVKTILQWVVAIWVIVIPLSLLAMSWYYPSPESWAFLFIALNTIASLGIFLTLVLFIIILTANILYKKTETPLVILFALLCAVPFIWQIDAIFLARLYGAGLGGYSFWIPVMLKIFGFIF